MTTKRAVLLVAIPVAAVLMAVIAPPYGVSARIPGVSEQTSPGAFMWSSPPPPQPPPPVPGAGEIQWVYAETSYTASGNTQVLTRIKDVQPVYAPMAMTLGVQGTVVVEASIDHRGRVTNARIVESVPLLNQSVIDAVKQWQFDARTVNAAGDPIRMTVTATFVPPR